MTSCVCPDIVMWKG